MNDKEALAISQQIPGTGGRPDYAEHLLKMVKQLPDNSTIIEIGTQSGGSAITMAAALKDRGVKIYCIDPCFVAKDKWPESYNKYSEISKYSLLGVSDTAEKFGVKENLVLIPGTSEDVFKTWEQTHNEKCDMLFIDGEHTYMAVKFDMLWERYIKDKGILMLDDWIIPVKDACDEYMKDKPNWKQRSDGSFFPMYYTRGYGGQDIHKM